MNEKEKIKFLDYSFAVFKKYFQKNRRSFDSFYASIDPKDKKGKFLRLASYYKFLIADGNFTVKSDGLDADTYVDYLDHTYKYVALFSLIEALYTNSTYADFYSWTKSKTAKINFPIKNKATLDDLHKKYLSIHGSTQKVIRFFESLDDDTKTALVAMLKIKDSGSEATIADLAKLLFQIRHDFVHEAKLITQFNTGTSVYHAGSKVIINKLNIESMKVVFEKGFLIFFGFNFKK